MIIAHLSPLQLPDIVRSTAAGGLERARRGTGGNRVLLPAHGPDLVGDSGHARVEQVALVVQVPVVHDVAVATVDLTHPASVGLGVTPGGNRDRATEETHGTV